MKIGDLLTLPWTWVGPSAVEEQGDIHFEMRIQELPEFYAAGASASEAKKNAKESLKAYFQSYLEHGEMPPIQSAGPSWEYRVVAGEAGMVNRSEETVVFPEDCGDLQVV